VGFLSENIPSGNPELKALKKLKFQFKSLLKMGKIFVAWGSHLVTNAFSD
jgi:hypothetical protein